MYFSFAVTRFLTHAQYLSDGLRWDAVVVQAVPSPGGRVQAIPLDASSLDCLLDVVSRCRQVGGIHATSRRMSCREFAFDAAECCDDVWQEMTAGASDVGLGVDDFLFHTVRANV